MQNFAHFTEYLHAGKETLRNFAQVYRVMKTGNCPARAYSGMKRLYAMKTRLREINLFLEIAIECEPSLQGK